MDASAEQLVLDYLGRLGDAAQRALSLDERLRFMVSARVAIAGQIEGIGTASAADVRRLLGRFGDPEELAATERQRLDEASRASAARSRDAEPAQVAEPAQAAQVAESAEAAQAAQAVWAARRTAPGAHRPVTARWRPGAAITPRQAGQSPADRSPADESAADRGAADQSPADGGVAHRRPVDRGAPGRSTADRSLADRVVADRSPAEGDLTDGSPAGRGAPDRSLNGRRLNGHGVAGGGPGAESPRPAAGAGSPDREAAAAGPGPLRRLGPWTDGGGSAGGGSAGGAAPPMAAGTGRSAAVIRSVLLLARAHPLESVAVLLLGVGGLVSPFPMWFLGALVVLISRLWDARDKWASLAAPAVLALMGSFVMAGQGSRRGGFPGYLDAVRADGWDLLRVGAVLGAAYLAWRIRQGRRARREPPWRRVPHA